MTNSRQYSLITSLAALAIAVILICWLFYMRATDGTPIRWYEFGDLLAIFMAAFCRLLSVLFGAKLPAIGRQFNLCALFFLAVALIWFIVLFFIN